MSHSKTLKQQVRVSSVFPVTHLVSPTTFETKNGMVGAVIKVEGVAFTTELNETLNQQSQAFHQWLTGLDETVMVYVTTHRKKQTVELEGEFSSEFAARVNSKYHRRFKGQNIYHNHHYVTILVKGNTSSNFSKLSNWIKKVAGNQLGEMRAMQRACDLKKLNSLVELFCVSLADFNPYLLGSEDDAAGFSELMAFLSLIPNGGEPIRFQNPIHCPPVASEIQEALACESRYPNGHLGQYVSDKRVLIGNAIQFSGVSQNDSRFGALLSIKKYPAETAHTILDPLLELDCEFIATQSFAPLIRNKALEHIRIKRGKLNSAEDLAKSQIEALEVLEDEVAGEQSILGYHHNTLMVLSDELGTLDETVNEVKKVYGYTGMSVVREILNADVMFLSQVPGNTHLIARASLITSRNFTDFCPLHNYHTGFYNENFLGSAVTLLETPSKTPLYFNFHQKGSKTNPSLGHATLYGVSDAGKTTLVNFFDSQMNRYNARSFYIDRDFASKIYVLASGNSSYVVIAPEYAGEIAMNPLMLDDTRENRTFLKNWLAELVKKDGELDIPSETRAQLSECIDYSFTSLERRYRTLSNVTQLLPIDFPRWPELRRWMQGNGLADCGEYAWLFDNDCDALDLSFDKVGIDVTYLMDKVAANISTPVYMYLTHRIEQALDGIRPTQITIDEAWQVLDSPYWQQKLKQWLATIRKKNGFIVFMTQSPETVAESPLNAVIQNNTNVSMYFPNPKGSQATYIDKLGLTEAEYQIIKNNAASSRLFLVKQNRQSVLCKLDLSELAGEIRVLSGNEKSARLADEVIAEFGAEPSAWLEPFIERSAS